MLRFWNKSLESALNETRLISVNGVRFRIKKIDPFSYMDGSQAVAQIFQTYEQKKEISEPNMERVRSHYRDVFLAGVVEPKLKRKADGEGVLVDNLFTDWELANKLYAEVIGYTYGKKKMYFS
jgi:hypothetical protein